MYLTPDITVGIQLITQHYHNVNNRYAILTFDFFDNSVVIFDNYVVFFDNSVVTFDNYVVFFDNSVVIFDNYGVFFDNYVVFFDN